VRHHSAALKKIIRKKSKMSTLDSTWVMDWGWSLPLILLNVLTHVFGLAIINDLVVGRLKDRSGRRTFMFKFTGITGIAVLLMIVLHWLEAVTWAIAYRMLDALPDIKTAMLFSLGAMTGFGASNLSLPPHWQMMGILQSLAGLLLFGLTTAFMFAMIQSVWPAQSGHNPSNKV